MNARTEAATAEALTLVADMRDLCGALALLVDAEMRRGDVDVAATARLLQRHAERVAEQVERLADERPANG